MYWSGGRAPSIYTGGVRAINAAEYLAYQLEAYIDLVAARGSFYDAMEAATGRGDGPDEEK